MKVKRTDVPRCGYETEDMMGYRKGDCLLTQLFESDDLRRARELLGQPSLVLCYYHTKVVLEQAEKPSVYLSHEEMDATVNGRRHGDGRRLDQYVIEDARSRPHRMGDWSSNQANGVRARLSDKSAAPA